MNLWVWLKGKYVMDKPSRYKLEMFLEEAFQKKISLLTSLLSIFFHD